MQWLQPLWLLGLTVPLALLLLALWPGRPVDVPTGALHLWRALASRTSGERRRLRPPLPLALIALAIAAALLALARPVQVAAAPPERWEVVLDLSPSCLLPLAPEDPASPRRIERALEGWEAFAERRSRALEPLGRGFDVLWHVAAGPDGPLAPVEASGGSPPPAVRALLAAGAPGPEPDWARFDRPGVVWLTDHPRPAQHAARFCSGGPAVPGPIGEGDGALVALAADGALTPGPPALPGALVLRGALPEPIAALAELWAEARGLARGGALPARLTLVGPEPAAASAADAPLGPFLAVERDGWRGRVRFPLEPPARAAHAEAWLLAAGEPAVSFQPAVAHGRGGGRVDVHVAVLEVDAAGSGSFAASFGALLDAALAPDPRVVPYAERRAAGEPSFDAPASATSTGRAPGAAANAEPRRELAPWLGGAAAALAALGLALGAPRRRRPLTGPLTGPGAPAR